MKSAWGDEGTRFFFQLTPDRVIDAVESSGFRCTGRCAALNSFENRVYELELEESEEASSARRNLLANRRVAKFYRPGRWTQEQILEEHAFLLELQEHEIPVVAPLAFSDGRTLHQDSESGIWYALFPKVGGRAPDEFSDDQLLQVGRLLARIHNVGAARPALHRIQLSPDSYGRTDLAWLLQHDSIPSTCRSRYEDAVLALCEIADPLFKPVRQLRIHGDCHFGNLLWNQQGPFFLDFDDMVRGPAVQDVWMLTPGRDAESLRQRELLLTGYEQLREFNHFELRLVEVLRAFRIIHYSAWIAHRWDDPAFPLAFPQFGTDRYWLEETKTLEEQLALVSLPRPGEPE